MNFRLAPKRTLRQEIGHSKFKGTGKILPVVRRNGVHSMWFKLSARSKLPFWIQGADMAYPDLECV